MTVDKRSKEEATAYRCPVHLIPEEDGGFSVLAANLPGVASQGDTEREATENIAEALAAAIFVYQEQAMPIPWLESPRAPDPAAQLRWVTVHV